jgi:hypothetical protein
LVIELALEVAGGGTDLTGGRASQSVIRTTENWFRSGDVRRGDDRKGERPGRTTENREKTYIVGRVAAVRGTPSTALVGSNLRNERETSQP